MIERDLFDHEKAAISRARDALKSRSPTELAGALETLIDEFDRVVRDMRRLINHSDRSERELSRANRQLRDLTQALEWRSRHDDLTGLLNRGAIIQEAQALIETQALGLVLVDIDHFKKINDTHGHPTGDIVLRAVARCLADIAGNNCCGRMGGEEFALLIPFPDQTRVTNTDCGWRLASRARECVEALTFEISDSLFVTASFGVAYANAGATFDHIYLVADDMLYQAKTQGRNRVETNTSVIRAMT